MKNKTRSFLLALVVFLNVPTGALAQQPVIIQGQITNCPESTLYCYYKSEYDESLNDTLHLDKEGRFYLRSVKLRHPALLNIRSNNIQVNNLFVAPGYQLNITGDGTDFFSLFRTKRITGAGSAVNRYTVLWDSLSVANNNGLLLHEMSEEALADYLLQSRKRKDSLAAVVFNAVEQTATTRYFAKMVQYDNLFYLLNALLGYTRINGYSYERRKRLLQQYLPAGLTDQFSNDSFLASYQYRMLAMGDYLRYRLQEDHEKDSTLVTQRTYSLDKVTRLYTKRVQQYVLAKMLIDRVENCKTVEQLSQTQAVLEPYARRLEPAALQVYRKTVVHTTESIVRLLPGKPAFAFSLQDTAGNVHSLTDFKGKVVYIDLWASWCGPCRAETPFLQELVEKYKGDNRLSVVSIAVSDGPNEWRKAVRKDQPGWLQLIDDNQQVYNTYIATMIPKFVLIDKRGNIISSDAPRPSNKVEIIKLLESAMND